MDTATSRTIRIGPAQIGLLGLDLALNRAAAHNLPEPEAIDFLFQAVRRDNYIPPGLAPSYREALGREYRQHLGLPIQVADHLVIRVFGSGCLSCNRLQALVIEALTRLQLAADIEQIHDPDEIGRHGILRTPALMINGQVKISGLMPAAAQIEQWLRTHTP